MVSKLPDADMQAAPKALLRAAQRARDIARKRWWEILKLIRRNSQAHYTLHMICECALRVTIPGEDPTLKLKKHGS
jgi:hypothetical protein